MPLIEVKITEGRSEENKRRLANKIMTACKEELNAGEENTWIIFTEKSADAWYKGYETLAEIRAKK